MRRLVVDQVDQSDLDEVLQPVRCYALTGLGGVFPLVLQRDQSALAECTQRKANPDRGGATPALDHRLRLRGLDESGEREEPGRIHGPPHRFGQRRIGGEFLHELEQRLGLGDRSLRGLIQVLRGQGFPGALPLHGGGQVGQRKRRDIRGSFQRGPVGSIPMDRADSGCDSTHAGSRIRGDSPRGENEVALDAERRKHDSESQPHPEG